MERAEDGFAHIYNLDYEEARQVFALLEKEYPKHPAPPLYLACILWLEEMLRRQDLTLNRFLYPSYFSAKTDQVMPPRERDAFFNNLRKCESLAKAILQKDRRDKDGRYFLATSCGLRSSFAITIDHSLSAAFRNGRKTYSAMRGLVEDDPHYYDAYLTVGIYEYIVGSIPWYLKWMALMAGGRGNKQDGLRHLILACEKGQYVRVEAQIVSMVLYVREHRYSQALEIARDLDRKFPRSFLFPLNVAQTLKMAGQWDQAVTAFLQVEKRVEAREPNFDKVPLQTFRYNLGVELMSMGKHDLAQERFQKSIEDPLTPERERALSHLRLGRILEWKAKKKEAIAEYQTVLSLKNVENSHTQARRFLNDLASR
jgi:tetratricopeptide (TPR) repeat protein